MKEFQRQDKVFEQKQKQNFDSCHQARPLPELPDDSKVWVTTNGQQSKGQVASQATAPRSYVVNTSSGYDRIIASLVLCQTPHHPLFWWCEIQLVSQS